MNALALLAGAWPSVRAALLKIAPAALILGCLALLYWAGYHHGQSVARAEAAQDKADALAATLAAQREVADQIAADRIKLADITEKLDKRQDEIRRIIRTRVANENLDAWYRGDINGVERVALYGLPPAGDAGTAVPDVGSVPDPTDPAAVPLGPRQP